jgi:AraC-like DNA-binding protein
MPGPVQTVEFEASPGRWRFASAPPGRDMAAIVVEYWEVEGRLSPFREKVLPNGCVELMINLGPPHRLLTAGGSSVWERAWFSGLHDRSLAIESLSGTHLVSARLHPLGATSLFGPAVAGAVNAVVDLEMLLGHGAHELRERLLRAASPEERFGLLEQFLRPRISQGDVSSALVRTAARRIEETHGSLRIASLHAELGVSRKHLWLLFARDVGMSPKAYAQIQRFVWTLARLRESTSVDWPRLALDAGYSDQSHLARDFRRVAEASPTEFLRTRTPDGTALWTSEG